MAGRSGQRIASIIVDGIEIIACPQCKGKTVGYHWGKSFQDDSFVCEYNHKSYHTFNDKDKLLLTSGIIMEYNGKDDEFYKLKTRSNYAKLARLILNQTDSLSE